MSGGIGLSLAPTECQDKVILFKVERDNKSNASSRLVRNQDAASLNITSDQERSDLIKFILKNPS